MDLNKLNNRGLGVLGVFVGVGCIAFTWYRVHFMRDVPYFYSMFGPLILLLSLAKLLLPPRWLIVPIEQDGKLVYPTKNINPTTLASVLFTVGLLAAIAHIVYAHRVLDAALRH